MFINGLEVLKNIMIGNLKFALNNLYLSFPSLLRISYKENIIQKSILGMYVHIYICLYIYIYMNYSGI